MILYVVIHNTPLPQANDVDGTPKFPNAVTWYHIAIPVYTDGCIAVQCFSVPLGYNVGQAFQGQLQFASELSPLSMAAICTSGVA